MKFVPVYQEIPEDLRQPFEEQNVYKMFEDEKGQDYMYENSDKLKEDHIWHYGLI